MTSSPSRYLEGLPTSFWFGGSLAILVAALATGTNFDYALLLALYTLFLCAAYTFARGLSSVHGLTIASFALQGPLLAAILKSIMFEPADEGLLAPFETIAVFAGGMGVIALGSLAVRVFPVGASVVKPTEDVRWLQWSWVFGAVLVALRVAMFQGWFPDAVSNALIYAHFAGPLMVGTATAWCLVRSGSKNAIDWRVTVSVGYLFMDGLSHGAKQAMAETVTMWALTAWAYGFRFRRRHAVVGLVVAWVFVQIIFPLALLRSLHSQGSLTERLATLGELTLESSGGNAEILATSALDPAVRAALLTQSRSYAYFNIDSAALDRINFYPISDLLVARATASQPLGWDTFSNAMTLLPRAFTGFGVDYDLSNLLGRVSGILAANDRKTGVSFGPFAENFAILGVIDGVIATLTIWILYGIVMSRVLGRLHFNVWTCAIAIGFRHVTSETSSVSQVFVVARLLPAALVMYGAAYWAYRYYWRRNPAARDSVARSVPAN